MKRNITRIAVVIISLLVLWVILHVLLFLLTPNHNYSKIYAVLRTVLLSDHERSKSEQLVISEDQVIQNIEISGDDIGVLVKSGVRAKLKNVHIHNNKKGIYVESGARLTLVNSIVEHNEEEGIDIREFARVSIVHNIIRDNTESGIEMESEGVKAFIAGNVITDNKAKGLTVQYRKGEGKKAYIWANHINNNSEYDVACYNTVGKVVTPKGFFCDFMSLYGNFGSVKGCKWSECKKTTIAL